MHGGELRQAEGNMVPVRFEEALFLELLAQRIEVLHKRLNVDVLSGARLEGSKVLLGLRRAAVELLERLGRVGVLVKGEHLSTRMFLDEGADIVVAAIDEQLPLLVLRSC